MNRLVKTFALAAPLVLAAQLSSNSAEACGGCFVPPAENTVVSGHRMALSISMQRTVLWDQIQYQGNPEEFSWVLPIKPGATIEVADNAWFEALESTTATTVSAPFLQCGNGGGDVFGCGNSSNFGGAQAEDSGGDPPVTVVKQETVGPYEAVTLSSEDPEALALWLESHNYAIPDDVKPVMTAYVNEGFDFIALRLIPGNGVNLMAPVRVITQGASPLLPLRMVAAGTGPFTSIVLYVIGEGRWTTDNFPEIGIPYADLIWDGDANESNYADLRAQVLSYNNGRTWTSTYAQPGALFDGSSYDGNGESFGASRIGYTYLQTVVGEDGAGWNTYSACETAVYDSSASGSVVVDTCDPVTGVCGDPGAGQIDARDFTCGELTDLSAALVGMHPQNVWVTRLEANLPRAALADDLTLAAHPTQKAIDNIRTTPTAKNYECPAAPFEPGDGKGPSGNGTPLVLVGLGALAALLIARRRSPVPA